MNAMWIVASALAIAVLAITVAVISRRRKFGERTVDRALRSSEAGRKERDRRVVDPEEDEQQQRLNALRNLQRAEKIREAAEDAETLERQQFEPVVDLEEDDQERRLRALREFQRAEKIREAAEEAELTGPVVEVETEPSIEKLIAQEVIDLRNQEQAYEEQHERQQELTDRAETSRVVGEARDLVVDLNAQFGWSPGEPSIADRMFNTDVESVIGEAVSTGKVNFRMHAMVASMRHFARANTGGRSELAKVMATRTLLGSGNLTNEESRKLQGARELFGDDFAEAAGFADRMARSQELVTAKQLGLKASRERKPDHGNDRSFTAERGSIN